MASVFSLNDATRKNYMMKRILSPTYECHGVTQTIEELIITKELLDTLEARKKMMEAYIYIHGDAQVQKIGKYTIRRIEPSQGRVYEPTVAIDVLGLETVLPAMTISTPRLEKIMAEKSRRDEIPLTTLSAMQKMAKKIARSGSIRVTKDR